MLDRYSIASRSIEVTLLWTPLDSFIWRELKLDTSQSIEICVFYIYIYIYIYLSAIFFSLILSNLSRQKNVFPSSKHLSLTLFIFLTHSLASRVISLSCIIFSLTFIMHFISFDLTFGVFEKFWVFQN